MQLPISSPSQTRPVMRVAIALLVMGLCPAMAASPLQEFSDELQKLVARVSPSVVQVLTTGISPTGAILSSSGDLLTQHGGGSGVILDSEGYIITNAHVVAGASRVQVLLQAAATGTSILQPRSRLLGAQVVAIDVETDLAVLKIRGHNLPTLELADSDDLGQGQLVLAFGSPRGLENSVTMGTVSARARQLRAEDPMIYIQTDATINPGSSGGPLVDSQGRVVGINTLIFSRSGGSEGIGFAAPSNIVRSVFEQIRDTGRVRRGVIGIYAQTLTPALAAGLGTTRDWGAILSDVTPGQPADRVGMRPGDIVLSLDDKVMENGRQLTVNLYNKPIGRRVRLEILRGEEQLSFEVEVVERRDDPTRFVDFVDPDRNLVQPLGILCLEIDERIARLLPKTRKPATVVVAARAPGAPYWEGGFEPGDILYSLNGLPVTGLDALRSRIEVLRAGDAVVFQVERDGRLRYVALRL